MGSRALLNARLWAGSAPTRLRGRLGARARLIAALAPVLAATFACGSWTTVREDVPWLLEQGIGQLDVLARARPVSDALADPAIEPAAKRRLRLIQAAARFARDDLGLTVGHQYRTVSFLDRDAVVWVVVAAPRTSLKPYTWTYPVLGALPYRGYFDREVAERKAEQLRETLDATVRSVPTYSLLGVLPDPIVSPMLFASDEAWLIETVIHELAHATVFAAGHGAFNEGLATFIGREGARRFVQKHYGPASAIALAMKRRREDRESYSRATGALAFDLRVLFAQAGAIDDAELLDRKKRLYAEHQRHFRDEVAPTLHSLAYRRTSLPENNASLSAYGIYTLQQALYERAFASCREDFPCFLAALKRAARAERPELSLAESLGATGGVEQVLP